ncbi:MAG: SGNH/GDSL hydrolase family protein [Rubrivivax sp.]|nr:SGNH/GDSL hydrolase family protein [Rubrivivax sp.]
MATGTDTVGISEFAVWALPTHYPMAQLIGHFGIDGQDTLLMLADDRTAPFTGQPMAIQDVIDAAPDLVILRGGSINDLQSVSASSASTAVSNCLTNHRTILQRMVNGGLKVLDCGIFGYGDGSLANNSNPTVVRNALLQVNAGLATMAGSFGSSVRYVSPLNTLHDSTGRFLSGMTIDGLHLSLAGGLAQAKLEADAMTAWLGAGTGTAYPGTNLMLNAAMTATGAPGVTPTGYSAAGSNAAVSNQLVETIGGKTFFTTRASLPIGSSSVVMRLPFKLSGLATNEVIGCEFDFLCERVSGSTPRLTEFDARQEYVWSGGRITHYAGYSARATSAATTTAASLTGRVVFLPFKLPASGATFDSANQSDLWLNLGFGTSASSVVKVGVGNPRLVRA